MSSVLRGAIPVFSIHVPKQWYSMTIKQLDLQRHGVAVCAVRLHGEGKVLFFPPPTTMLTLKDMLYMPLSAVKYLARNPEMKDIEGRGNL